jgi:hypothetical protein
LHVQGGWFSPGIPASSTTKTYRHDIAEILLKVALKHQKYIINATYQLFCLVILIFTTLRWIMEDKQWLFHY